MTLSPSRWRPLLARWLVPPMLLAGALGFMIFRSRITGVYFSIITQALALIMSILFIGQQPYTGGTNGITNLTTIFGLPLESPRVQLALFLVSVLTLALIYLL